MRTIAVVVQLLALALAPAARAIGFTSSFESIKIKARPGEVMTRSYHLHLKPGQPKVRFHSHVEDWWQSEDGKQSFYSEPGTLAHSCGNWIALDPVETDVQPGATLTVRVTASVPATAGPGGYWCVLTVDEIPDPLAARQGVNLRFVTSVSTGIFIDLAPVVRDVRISAVALSARQARITLRNAGNAPAAVEGRVELFHPGEPTPVVTAPLERTTVLTEPVATRVLNVKLPDLARLPAGRYLLQVVLDLGLDHDTGIQKELVIPDDLVHLP
jgi:hypothetical protein